MEADRQLNDNFHYEQIDEVNLENTQAKVNEIINKIQNENCIDEISLKYIRNEQGYAKKPFAYFLPNIHKLESGIHLSVVFCTLLFVVFFFVFFSIGHNFIHIDPISTRFCCESYIWPYIDNVLRVHCFGLFRNNNLFQGNNGAVD
jgi:hypothetical protein